ncbi:hypothetical protein CYLTODRAFT_368778 [Cylindrobasidium torrendii FP15055 ss-10]|uniref:histidine kinase n=1 Tax=Cylindrobasidium torrendii FP15055 ss-10 TaxID=1314674 RepID=A0A0D7BNE4_9AGAR|nr:hypothetical protein CYLTODRAFT_368778 [Cylindrobasidium torrendii FP15055 ss-10]
MKPKRPSTAPGSDQTYFIPNGMQVLVEDDDVDDADSSSSSAINEAYDWNTFIAAYASGRWEPHRIPNPPVGVARDDDHVPELFEMTEIPHRKPARASSSHRMRNSFSTPSGPPIPSSSRDKPNLYLPIQRPTSTPASVVSAATLRLAGTHVNLAPLALPSPEHEFTDPLRGVSVVVPGVHPDETLQEIVMTPGGTRRIRLNNFWKGVSEPGSDEDISKEALVTTPADYFSHHESTAIPPSAEVAAKRAHLARQSSAPLPPPPSVSVPVSLSKCAAESREAFSKDGYLVPPNPPTELDRRRALYQFNIWGTAPDPNFERIAHLTMLVFGAKGVYISLVDANDIYFKSERGLKISPCARNKSFCGHAILQRDDEPLVILDTHEDWRFANHPLVTSAPHIRFYAGAPLKTADGHNVGTLSVIDDTPRNVFNPRHRHTLKEFAAIAMREMELWRDKIQLRVRDKIQASMEQFSRECIEVELDETGSKSDYSKSSTPVSESTLGYRPSLPLSAPSTPTPGDLIPSISRPILLGHREPSTETRQKPRLFRSRPSEPLLPSMPSIIATRPSSDNVTTLPDLAKKSLKPSASFSEASSPLNRAASITFSSPAPSKGSTPTHPDLLHTKSSTESSPSRPSLKPRYSSQHKSFLQQGSMDKVYARAARLIQRTLDVDDVIVMDVSHCDVNADAFAPSMVRTPGGTPGVEPHGVNTLGGKAPGPSTPTGSTTSPHPTTTPPVHHPMAGTEGTVSVAMYHGDPAKATEMRKLRSDEWSSLWQFFERHPDGKVMEGIVEKSWRAFLPTRVSYALTVPIFNIDNQPFALLCAYNLAEEQTRCLEGHELSYLRAIGVIILSAVLKRRMILADKAKSLFISNISHELRTPLHGILAAAELLDESNLGPSQSSFLQTIQACGTSLVETVNHVLDFTKLSGNSKSGGVENVIVPMKVNLMQLVEEAVDGCWVGHRARQAISGDTGIGSVYSPPQNDAVRTQQQDHVETVVDIGQRPGGWLLKCEKGGIRRVLMNIFGNSLKFTKNGYVHVSLRQAPPQEGDPPDRVKVELSVLDTGKGISKNFQRNQLFHPFSQENPLLTGTGLGLAIVNSIIHSDTVDGRIDVWSEEGVGTEIKITFSAQVTDEDGETSAGDMEPFKFDDPDKPLRVSLIGFEDDDHIGTRLLLDTVRTYISTWWGFSIQGPGEETGDIVILNEGVETVAAATENHDISRPFIILSGSRGSPQIMSVTSEHERIGGICRAMYKPGGPTRLRSALSVCVHALKIQAQGSVPAQAMSRHVSQMSDGAYEAELLTPSISTILPARRNSEEPNHALARPPISRSATAHPTLATSWKRLSSTSEGAVEEDQETTSPTITIGPGGTLLRSSVGSVQSGMHPKILVVEDNPILRNLLIQWLMRKGYEFRDAVDGRDGVNIYTNEGPFDVVLLDLSMPVLDGVGATTEIRQFEAFADHTTKILALTGMSSLEDKRRAFDAGVDGYLVKPVAFKTLDEMFHKLGMP